MPVFFPFRFPIMLMCHLGNNQSATQRCVKWLHHLRLITMLLCTVHSNLKHLTSAKSFDTAHLTSPITHILTIPPHYTYQLRVCIVLNWHMSVSGKVRSIIIEPFQLCTVASAQQVSPLLNNNCRKWIQLRNWGQFTKNLSLVITRTLHSHRHVKEINLFLSLVDRLYPKLH